ncbi:MAG: CheA signal transduction histidine kinase [Gemmatimonadetes bacterium]|nr:CheA signal transduction histidine kinase [Gemmatimonadota bacterium]
MDSAQYAELFLTESREHVSAINHSLLELERGEGGAEPVGAIFRSVHTIKGMSATMGYGPVASLSHELETLLDRVRQGRRTIDPPLMDLLFRSADVLEGAIEAAVGGDATRVDVEPLVAALKADSARNGASGPAAGGARAGGVPAPSAPDVGAWTAAAPAGAGLLVRVRLATDTALKGVRAFLVVQAARALGEVTSCSPAVEQLQADEFDHDLALRLQTTRTAEEVEAALRTAGDVVEVRTGEDPVVTPSLSDTIADMGDTGEFSALSGAPARAPAGDGTSASGAVRQQRSVRIDLRRLDNLMNLIGELVITRGRLSQISVALNDPALAETVAQATRLVADLQDEIMTSRMVPVWQVFDRFPRLVRDAARSVGKSVDLVIEGKEVELDRSMLDEVGDPIVHLLRNAVDHGIETPDVRRAAGKPEQGRLTLSALRDRSAVAIRVSDDGRGIDRDRVLRRAIADGLVESTRTELTDEELLRLISRAGFSTAETITDLSGRGVGIDAVYNRVRALGGSVDIRTAPGKGTTVTLRLPLTLAIVRSLLARIGDETYAVPMTHVSETVELHPKILRTLKGREMLMLRDEVLPVMRLRQLMGYDGAPKRGLEQVVIVEMAERRAGLVVDDLIGQQEIVVKQFDGVREGLALFGGATILGDGAPALIIDVSSLL